MEEQGYVVINGRTAGDTPALYTFINSQGNKSIIDLAWTNLNGINLIRDLKVSDFVLKSDHLPVMVEINSVERAASQRRVTKKDTNQKKIMWNNSNQLDYTDRIKTTSPPIINHLQINEAQQQFSAALREIAKNSKMEPTQNNKKPRSENPWYDSHCMNLKKDAAKAFTSYTKAGYDVQKFHEYKDKKKAYNALIKNNKTKYYDDLKTKISSIKSSKEFWDTINRFRYNCKNKKCEIAPETWTQFFESFYETIDITHSLDTHFTRSTDPFLDQEITLSELELTLKSLKNAKAPGPDTLAGEFYKNLDARWQKSLLTLFNKTLTEEKTPESWAQTKICMIHKKGDRKDPNNYRCISLLNNITKIFTAILNQRLQSWVEERNIITDTQFGFRKGKSCIDAIFLLHSTISLNIRLPKRKVYATFVDLQKAFDSVTHSIMWNKLRNLGISTKIINVIKALYDQAALLIENENDNKPIKITKGVLQGETLSPILFNLFINDLTTYLTQRKIRGLNIDGRKEILTISYADDLVILTDSPIMAQKAINELNNYCNENNLIINKKKTKNVIFRKSGRPPRNLELKLEKEILENVNKICYLGVTFSSSGLFRPAMEDAIKKATTASSRLIEIMTKSKFQGWEARKTIFNSLVTSTLLYGAEIWSPRYLEEIEKVNTRFYKRVFNWPKSTPNYIVRAEAGVKHIGGEALKRILQWLRKLQTLEEDSILKSSFHRLAYLAEKTAMPENLNWTAQIKNFMNALKIPFSLNHTLTSQDIESAVNKFHQQTLLQDKELIINSTFSPTYQLMLPQDNSFDYISSKLNFGIIKLISQLRVTGERTTLLTANGCLYYWDQTKTCEVCNQNEPETLEHFLLRCPIYNALRTSMRDLDTRSRSNLLSGFTTDAVKKIHIFVCNALKIRSFMLDT